MAYFIAFVLFGPARLAAQPAVSASSAPALGIEAFVELAQRQSLRSRRAELERQVAAFAKDIVFRGTVGPIMTASLSANQDKSTTNGDGTKTQTGQGALTVAQPLLTGGRIDLSTTYSSNLVRAPTAVTHDTLRPGWSASLTQPVFAFVGNPALRSRSRARLSYDFAGEVYRADVLGVRSQARALYYDVLLKRESLGVEARKLEASRALLEITRELVDAGKLAGIETLRSRVRMERDRRQYETALNELRKSEQSAKSFVQLPLDQELVFTSTLSYQPFRAPLETLTSYALEHRPQLAQLDRTRRLAEIDLSVTREPTRPTLNLSAAYNSNETYTTLNALPSSTLVRDWNAGATVAWRFFDFSVTRQQVRQAAAILQRARIDYDQAVRDTVLSVMKAHMDVKTAERQLVGYQDVIDSARNNVNILRVQFQSGRGKVIDVFDAENEARSADLEYLNLLVNFYVLQDTLVELVGGAPAP